MRLHRHVVSGTHLLLVAIAMVLAGCSQPAEPKQKGQPPVVGTIVLSTEQVPFEATVGGAAPADGSVAINSSGAGVSGLTASASYGSGAGGWLTPTLSATSTPAMLALRVAPGTLAAGTYTSTVTISGSSGVAAQHVTATLLVRPAIVPAPAIGLEASLVNVAALAGGASPAAVRLDVTNVGGGTLSGLEIAGISYAAGQPSGWLTATLQGATAPTTLSLGAVTGALAAGSYDASVTVRSSIAGVVSRAVAVKLVVSASPLIAPSEPALTFAALEGGASPAPVQVSIANGGGGSLTALAARVLYRVGEPAGWLAAALNGTSAPATLTTSATVGSLSAGSYHAIIELTSPGASNSPMAIQVTFLVSAPPVIALSSASLNLFTFVNSSNPNGSIGITNAGGGTLSGLSTTVTYVSGVATGWLNAALLSTSAPTTINVTTVIAGLPVGDYSAVISVSSSQPGVVARQVAVSLVVSPPAANPQITLDATSVAFSAFTCAASPAAQVVHVTNGGTGSLSGLQASVSYASGAGWLSATLDGTTAPATLTLTPSTASLAPGTYTANVAVSGSASNSPRVIPVSMTVTSKAVVQLGVSTASFTAPAGQRPAVQIVGVTNGCATSAPLTGLTVTINYVGQSTAWLGATMQVTTAPTTISLQPSTSTMPVGTYTANVVVSSSLAGTVPATIVVTYVVTAPAPTYSLTTALDLPDGGTILRNPDQTLYAPGTTVSLRASTYFGWNFVGWTGDVTSTANPVNVTMDANKSVTAKVSLFAPDLAAPAITYTGEMGFYWTFEWPCNGSGCLASSSDHFELEESRTSSVAGFVVVHHSPDGTQSSPYNAYLLRSVGTYYYRVRAFTRFGTSPYSVVRTIVVTTPPLSAPTNLTAVAVSSTQINLSWTNNGTGATATDIERCAGANCTAFTGIGGTSSATVSTFASTGLVAGTSYTYRARASNSTSASQYSNLATAVTQQPPASPTVQFVNNSSWPIISLKIDNVEQVTVAGTGISSGSSHTFTVSAGAHSYRVGLGIWDAGVRSESYNFTGTFTGVSGAPVMVTVVNPTVAQLLSGFQASRTWDATFFDAAGGLHTARFRFASNGTCVFYVDGAQDTTCTFSGTYGMNLMSVRVRYANGAIFDGVLYEAERMLDMPNGPNRAAIRYSDTGNP